jgi:dTDP-4-dehydrorhamnose reductase
MKILLMGASSYVGARLYFDLSKNHEVTGTFSSHPLSKKFISLDVTKIDDVKRVVENNKPDVIIHAANNASAKWCDANPEKAILLNEQSTQYILDAAGVIGSKIIYISSFSATDMSSVYGRTKHASEELVKESKNNYCIIRPSLIIGFSPNTTNDRPFNRILKNLEETPAVYDTSWKFQPTYIRHISEVIQDVIVKQLYGKTIHIAVSDVKSRFDIAKDILSPFGVAVTPVNNNDHGALLTDDLKMLTELGLPQYTYEEMTRNIVDEIRQRESFVIQ